MNIYVVDNILNWMRLIIVLLLPTRPIFSISWTRYDKLAARANEGKVHRFQVRGDEGLQGLFRILFSALHLYFISNFQPWNRELPIFWALECLHSIIFLLRPIISRHRSWFWHENPRRSSQATLLCRELCIQHTSIWYHFWSDVFWFQDIQCGTTQYTCVHIESWPSFH